MTHLSADIMPGKAPGNRRFLKYLLPGLFFPVCIIYFYFFARHIFIYQEKYSLFIVSSDFLNDFLSQPGGLLKYFAEFLSTFYYYSLAGAFIASAVILLNVIFLSEIFRAVAGKRNYIVPFIAGLIMFHLQADYRYMLFNNLGILLQLSLALLFIKHPKGFLPVIILPFWYFISGGFAWMFYGIYCVWLATSDIKKNLTKILSSISVSFITLYVCGEFLFWHSYRTLFLYPWSPGNSFTGNILFTVLGAMICATPLLSKLRFQPSFSASILKGKSGDFIYAALFTLVLAGVARLGYDEKSERYFRAEKLFYEGKYDELISYNLKYPTRNIITIFLNNIALCETGRLNDMLFSFPQSRDGSTLFLKWEMQGEILRHGGNFYFTTGMINEAYRWAYEYMTMRGYTPEGLKMMIKCELINGNYRSAEVYINLLGKTLFYRKEASRWKKFLFNDQAVASDPLLGQKRKIKVSADFFTITDDPAINLKRVVVADTLALNRNAWEYGISWLLLDRDYKGIAEEWLKTGRYGFKKIPRHLEEAAVAMKSLLKVNLPEPGPGLRINNETEFRFANFLRTFQAAGNDLKRAEPFLRRDFGNTYWYYIFYR